MKYSTILHPPLRPSMFPRWLRRGFNHDKSSLVRLKNTQKAPRASKDNPIKSATVSPSLDNSLLSTTSYAKSRIRRGPPERILIYHGGTGKTVLLGVLRITTIFVFGVSCLVVAPAFFASEFPSYIAPAVVAGGALPLLFVSYTAAPFVNYIHLALPIVARQSREKVIQYAHNLPPNATLYINTMKFTTIPRRTEVRISDLTPDKALLRPVSFRNQNSVPLPWWQGRTLKQFYTSEKSKPARATSTFYPELWEHVYKQIQNNMPQKPNY